ncbi:MAG: hypothetical protein WD028_12050 [Balneolaceae bacterium]
MPVLYSSGPCHVERSSGAFPGAQPRHLPVLGFIFNNVKKNSSPTQGDLSTPAEMTGAFGLKARRAAFSY